MREPTEERRVDLGFGGLRADAGDHIGHFYRTTEEWRDLAVPFLRLGLERGEKCVCIVSPGTAEGLLLAGLVEVGVDVSSAVDSGQLLVSDGQRKVAAMQKLLVDCIEEVPGRFSFLRWAGDMTWAHGKMPSSETLMEWECACNVVEEAPVLFLCQYDLGSFSGSVVIDALKTHPLCVMGGVLHRNPYFEEPESFLEGLRRRGPSPTGLR